MTLSTIELFIAEDHALFRELIISSLKDYNIIVTGEAEHGLRLLELLKTKQPDMVLLDIEMETMGGSETFLFIKELYPKLKVVFLSTHKENTLIDYFYSKGASAYLTKNTDMETVAQTIRSVYEDKYTPNYTYQSLKLNSNRKIKFSKRETEILPKIVAGKSNSEIAEELNITNKAIEAHKNNLFKKTNTKRAGELISYVIKKGLDNMR